MLSDHGIDGFLSVNFIVIPCIHHRYLALFVAAILDDCVDQEGYVDNYEKAKCADDELSLVFARLLADARIQELLQLAREREQHEIGEDLEVPPAEIFEELRMGIVDYREQCEHHMRDKLK